MVRPYEEYYQAVPAYIRHYKKQAVTILFSIILSMALVTGISSLLYSKEQSSLEKGRGTVWELAFPSAHDPGSRTACQKSPRQGYEVEKSGMAVVKDMISDPYAIRFVYADTGIWNSEIGPWRRGIIRNLLMRLP